MMHNGKPPRLGVVFLLAELISYFFSIPTFSYIHYTKNPRPQSGIFIFNYIEPTVLGYIRVSRMFCTPVMYMSIRSKPRPKPE